MFYLALFTIGYCVARLIVSKASLKTDPGRSLINIVVFFVFVAAAGLVVYEFRVPHRDDLDYDIFRQFFLGQYRDQVILGFLSFIGGMVIFGQRTNFKRPPGAPSPSKSKENIKKPKKIDLNAHLPRKDSQE